MKIVQTGMALVLALTLAVSFGGCELGGEGDAGDYGTSESALGAGAYHACPGLTRAWSNQCPAETNRCDVLEEQLEQHGCADPNDDGEDDPGDEGDDDGPTTTPGD